MADAACASLVACERACEPRDDVCLHACELARPGGVLGARAFGACVQSSCAKSCIGLSWSCLVRPARPPPPPVGGNARITYRFIDYETEAPIAGLVVRACNKMDVDCKNPLYESSTLADGIAVLRVPLGGSEIYAEVRGKTYGPILVFLPRLVGDYVAGTIPIATHATFLKLAAPIAIPNPSLGTVLASVVDCAGARAAGVTLAADPSHGSTRFYTRGRLPAATSTATDDDGFGAGGFVNVEAYTSISIQASVVENGLSFPRVEVVARPGAGYTHVEIRAAPP